MKVRSKARSFERTIVEMAEEKKEQEMKREDEVENESDEVVTIARVPPWTKQITVRGVVTSAIIGVIYSIIAMKLNLTTGLSPNLNVSAALLAFVFIRAWNQILKKAGFSPAPFTKQENTMIQTCAVACYSIAIGGGFGSYLLGLNKKTYELAGVNTEGNSPTSYKDLKVGWMTAYLFIVCFVGLFVLTPLRKILIVDYQLVFPSGMATAVLINGFHTRGDKMAKKQVRGFLKYFSMSFLWGFFQWFFNGKGNCGFMQFPTFGLQAWKQTFYFDFSMTYVGTGMICSHLVSLSLLFGAVLSWGLMWPLISKLKGDWFPENISEESMQGLNGYKVFISIALIFGDGFYNFFKVLIIILINVRGRMKQKPIQNTETNGQDKAPKITKQNEVFVRESIPMWVAGSGYIFFAIITVIALPIMFPEIKWYFVVVAYILAPALAFCNAYGAGLTDMNMAYNYGKVALFILAGLTGKKYGVVAGLVGAGLIKSMALVSCTLMQDLKTGHMTLTSPRAMLVSQGIGTVIGCIVTPLSFFLFYKAFDVGNPNGEYKAPYALIYRNMAILGVEGFSALPRHCLELCCGFFVFAIVADLIRDLAPSKIGRLMPLPMVMAVPFLVGGYFAIDMCVGSLVVFVWNKIDSKQSELMVPAVASGLICGEGLWSLPASFLALANVNPPICMTFLPSKT
ncbi:metal-nicotianamine transporter YSL1 isoform X1 [Beta vulgaris subsp. vulgaris]|uniref:metal-nicotianamine transporter YSL1 isoform X1 n=2 Tax=Beta vulgaris subsp. vulgaris TaxID=3555 RepID=UPI002036F967|nr:metal-nicotianamine transporter YSL1 isoform X1 [Beta vulgaris subsp. vulgaris]